VARLLLNKQLNVILMHFTASWAFFLFCSLPRLCANVPLCPAPYACSLCPQWNTPSVPHSVPLPFSTPISGMYPSAAPVVSRMLPVLHWVHFPLGYIRLAYLRPAGRVLYSTHVLQCGPRATKHWWSFKTSVFKLILIFKKGNIDRRIMMKMIIKSL